MNCPNCGFFVAAGANFCQNCGYRFDNIPQVEPIRVQIPQPAPEPPPVVPAAPPRVIVAEKKGVPTGAIIVMTALTVLVLIGGAALAALYFFNRPPRTEVAATNANTANANVSTAPKPSPTSYEDWKNNKAPAEKRSPIMDEAVAVAPAEHRAVPFTIENTTAARLVGGFRVTGGKSVNFYVYPAEAYAEYPTNGLKPVQFEQTRNKVLNERLKAGKYYLVFENADEAAASNVAAEFFIVYD